MEHLEDAKDIFSEKIEFETLSKLRAREISALIELGRNFYAFLNQTKENGKAFTYGLSELRISSLIEMTRLNLLVLISFEAYKQKYQLVNIYGVDRFIHLN
jgi:hypothetical protein